MNNSWYPPLVKQSVSIIQNYQIQLWLSSLKRVAPALAILLTKCVLQKEERTLLIDCLDYELAIILWKKHLKTLALCGIIEGLEGAAISWRTCKAPLRINFIKYLTANLSSSSTKPMVPRLNNAHPNLIEADYEEICDYLKLWRAEKKVVTITSMVTSRCLHVNDRVTPERGVLLIPTLWIGVNFMSLWRESMDDYNRLIDSLNSSNSRGYLPGFEYNILRMDGSFARYQKDYYLIRNYLGEPCRISVANADDWELLRSAPT